MNEPHRIIDIREALNDAYQYGLEAKGVYDPELANAALDDLTIKLTAKFDEAVEFAHIHPRDTKGNV